jgi:hypothetical protein
MSKENENFFEKPIEELIVVDLMRRSEEDDLVKIAVPSGSLVLSPKATKQYCRKRFKEWMEDTFNNV